MKPDVMRTELELLKRGHTELTSAIGDLKNAFLENQRTIVAEFRSIREELATKASPFPVRAVVGTAASSAAIVAGFITIANSWFESKQAPDRDKLVAIERKLDASDPALNRYRIDEMQRKLRLLNPMF